MTISYTPESIDRMCNEYTDQQYVISQAQQEAYAEGRKDEAEAAAIARWLPIDSAPRNRAQSGRVAGDCQRVLLAFGGGEISVGYWDSYYLANGHSDEMCWIEPVSGEQLALHYEKPTAWQDIPPPSHPTQLR
jgi:hypothetical protein